jgi:tetratricopeptide (TPR) repeat protein
LLLSVQAAEQADTPEVATLTGRLLRVAAVLDPTGIGPDLFAGMAPDTLPPVRARRVLRDAQERLLSRGLLTATHPEAGEPRWVMHRLVARVLRDRDAAENKLTGTLAEALDLLEPLMIPFEQAWTHRTAGDALVGHIHALAAAAALTVLDGALAQRLLGARRWAARHLYETADLTRAIPLYEQNLADMVSVLGSDHPDTLTTRNNLAGAYQSAGDLGRAIPLYEQNLTETLRVLGPHHPLTLASRGNLAAAFESAGDLGRAIPLHEQNLTETLRVLGPDHPDTLTTRHNLAAAYQGAGDLGRATPLYERTLTDRERVLGPNHPDTLASRNNLATAYEKTGDPARAIPLHEQTLADMVRVLGPDHPDTLACRGNLAYAHQFAGDLGRPSPCTSRPWPIRCESLAPTTPTPCPPGATSLRLPLGGRPGPGAGPLEQTLTAMVRVLGPDHPDTVGTRGLLSTARAAAAIPKDDDAPVD